MLSDLISTASQYPAIVPLRRGGDPAEARKPPRGWNEASGEQHTAAQLDTILGVDRDARLGMVLGSYGIDVIDIDRHEGESEEDATNTLAALGIGKDYIVWAGRTERGIHVYVRLPEAMRAEIGTGGKYYARVHGLPCRVDIRCAGKSFVRLHGDPTSDEFSSLIHARAEVPLWRPSLAILDRMRKPERPAAPEPPDCFDADFSAVEEAARAVVSRFGDDLPYHGSPSFKSLGMAIHAATGGSDAGLGIWQRVFANSRKRRNSAAECARHWRDYDASGGVGVGSLIYWAREAGWRPPERPDLREGIEFEPVSLADVPHVSHEEAKVDKPKLRIIRGDEIVEQPWSYLWTGWLPRGELAVLCGDGGVGKGVLLARFAAAAVGAVPWPDGERSAPGGFVLWVGKEDSLEKTLAKRMRAAGVPAQQWGAVEEINGKIAADLLASALPSDTRLIIADPLIQGTTGDANSSTAARGVAEGWSDVARRHDAVVLGVMHATKFVSSKVEQGASAQDLVAGSAQWVAVARSVLYYGKNGDGSDRILGRIKANHDVPPRHPVYRVGSVIDKFADAWVVEEFDPEPDGMEALYAALRKAPGSKGGPVARIPQHIEEYLTAHGDSPAREVIGALQGEGYSENGVEAAARRMRDAGDLEQRQPKRGAPRIWALPEG